MSSIDGKLETYYELVPKGSRSKGRVILKKRFFVGRSESCDISIDSPGIDSIHAVVEFQHGEGRIYDMNSSLGTYVNGQKIVVAEFKKGDTIRLGKTEFVINDFKPEDILPPPLEMLKVKPPKPPTHLPEKIPHQPPEIKLPKVEYPLAKDPRANYTEYIFEDVDTLYPVFQYQVDKIAVEVIINHKGKIHSVDFLPEKDGIYNLIGFQGKEEGIIEYPYLGKTEKVPFVHVRGHEVIIHRLPGHELQVLGKLQKQDKSTILLLSDEILRFTNKDLQIFVRRTEAPPAIVPPPFLRRDKRLSLFLWPLLIFVAVFSLAIQNIEIDKKEIEKEQAPERLAQILKKQKPKIYVSPKQAIEKTENAPKEIAQKSPTMEKSEPPKVKEVKEQGDPPKKIEAPIVANKKPAKTSPKPTRAKAAKPSPTVVPKPIMKQVVPNKNIGRVDTYKAVDFSPTMSSILSKGGTTKQIDTKVDVKDVGGSSFETGDATESFELAKVSQNIGSLSGSVKGKIDSTKGVSGLVSKTDVFTAGLPYKTVVLGGMDPDTIRRILVEHIPQFRYCYQQQLDASASAFHGVVKMNFEIGASGHVAKAAIEATTEGMPNDVRGCVRDVLMGIRFPEPPGGGAVEVRQPFNFYPKRT